MLRILYPSFLKGLLVKDGKLEFPMKIGAVQDILFLRISWTDKTRKLWPSVTIVSGPKCWYIQWILYISVLKGPLEKDGKLDFHKNRRSVWHTLPKYICDFFPQVFYILAQFGWDFIQEMSTNVVEWVCENDVQWKPYFTLECNEYPCVLSSFIFQCRWIFACSILT